MPVGSDVGLGFTDTTVAVEVVAGTADDGAADEACRSGFGGFGLSGAGFCCTVVVFSGEFVEIAIDFDKTKEIDDTICVVM